MNITKRIAAVALGAGVMVLGGCSPQESAAPKEFSTPAPTRTVTITATPVPVKASASPSETRTHQPRVIAPKATRSPTSEARSKSPAVRASDDRWDTIKPRSLVVKCKQAGWSFQKCKAWDDEMTRIVKQAGKEGVRKELRRQTKKSKRTSEEADSYKRQRDAGEPIEVGDANNDGVPDDIDMGEGQE